jgi:hypothetical protein
MKDDLYRNLCVERRSSMIFRVRVMLLHLMNVVLQVDIIVESFQCIIAERYDLLHSII